MLPKAPSSCSSVRAFQQQFRMLQIATADCVSVLLALCCGPSTKLSGLEQVMSGASAKIGTEVTGKSK